MRRIGLVVILSLTLALQYRLFADTLKDPVHSHHERRWDREAKRLDCLAIDCHLDFVDPDDCISRFPEGRVGIPLSHPAVASGKPAAEGFLPLYLMRQPVSVSGPALCDYVYTGDVFR